jgi:sulfonate transport system permease protein
MASLHSISAAVRLPGRRAAAPEQPASVSPAGRPPALEDLSPAVAPRRAARVWISWRSRLLRGAIPVLLLATWQAGSTLGLIPDYKLPAPAAIAAAFRELLETGDLQDALPTSISRSLIGLVLGGGAGLVLGLFAGLWRVGEELFDAPLQMLRTIPFIALVPLFITWFGIDETAKIALITAASIFPMYLNTYAGVRGVDNKLIEAGTVFGLSSRGLALRVILPTALPSILVGLRYSAGVSLLALVAAEQINARSGVGYILVNANQNQRPDIIIAGILVYAALGIAIDLAMRLIERIALPWRPKIALA